MLRAKLREFDGWPLRVVCTNLAPLCVLKAGTLEQIHSEYRELEMKDVSPFFQLDTDPEFARYLSEEIPSYLQNLRAEREAYSREKYPEVMTKTAHPLDESS